MAEATKFENIRALTHGDTISGPARFCLLVTAGSDTALLTLTIGSSALKLSALAGTSQELNTKIRLGGGQTATVSLTGTTPAAYAIDEVG